MDIQDLRTFLAISENRSFSKAAETLHISQPAVSKRIQALELSLGAQLFDRVGKRIFLTEAGELLIPQARHLLAMLADTERKVRNLSESVSGTLQLATSHHIGLHRLEPVLRRFITIYPEVQINIAFEDSEVAHDLVRQGEIELAVVTLNPEGDPTLQYQTVWHDPLVFVSSVAKSHPLALRDLAKLPCVLPGTATYTGRIVLQRFADQGITLQPAMSTNYLETIGMLVSVGLGWSVLPRSMATNLEVLQVDCAPMARTLGFVTNPERSMSNAAKAFTETLSAFMEDN